MSKQTLKFPSFGELSAFSKTLSIGYLINTNTLTITATFQDLDIQAAQSFQGSLVDTNERVYAYDPF